MVIREFVRQTTSLVSWASVTLQLPFFFSSWVSAYSYLKLYFLFCQVLIDYLVFFFFQPASSSLVGIHFFLSGLTLYPGLHFGGYPAFSSAAAFSKICLVKSISVVLIFIYFRPLLRFTHFSYLLHIAPGFFSLSYMRNPRSPRGE
jgi:hypothetical protein